MKSSSKIFDDRVQSDCKWRTSLLYPPAQWQVPVYPIPPYNPHDSYPPYTLPYSEYELYHHHHLEHHLSMSYHLSRQAGPMMDSMPRGSHIGSAKAEHISSANQDNRSSYRYC